ncbi:hypothetical protein EXIGLDRAFT_722107 [Exidia glandulosa HHB12029]|uniref:Uncharacterized protein n=1 Tax=Exidia glandulosa HHB12029 TaxID=1314781 RepID=A0A165FFW9_EXIGL|nr:hypothetical protein EXIGLDRAFT_722107 [Exidia glandulosa HHB12029]
MAISAQKLEQFVLRLDAPRPTLRLKGIAIPEMTLDPEDPPYLALLESVDSIEYGV